MALVIPKPKLTYGPYCFKATCELRLRGQRVGKFIGYGPGTQTAKITKDVCDARLDNLDGDYSCSAPDLVFVHGQDPEPGVFYVTDNGGEKRVL